MTIVESGWNLWVWLVGVVNRRQMWLYSGWNLWVWLECIGVVSGCCCKEVYTFPHNIYNYKYKKHLKMNKEIGMIYTAKKKS